MNHLGFFCFQIILNLQSFPSLFLKHIFIITFCSQIISDSHTEPVTNHRSDTKCEDRAWARFGSNSGDGDDEGGAETIKTTINSRLDKLSY
jgi:hypothetical protein